MTSEAPTDVVRTHLELSRHRLRAAKDPSTHAEIRRLERPSPSEYLEIYTRIGGPWHWRDRLAWPAPEMEGYLASPEVHVFTAEVGGENAGFFEFVRRGPDVVELMYFGLDQRFIGRGLGGWLLTRAAEEAFALGATRVIVNTCTLDAPQALPNYLARGFVITREERYTVILSATPAARPTT
jgi:GNAT superfamily N-acetyltransferase